MPSSSEPLPAPQAHAVPSSAALPAHALDCYRFDAHPPTEHPARRRRGNLPKEATARLNDWFALHATYPYPKEEEKQRLQEETGLSMSQVSLRHRTALFPVSNLHFGARDLRTLIIWS